MKRVAIFYNAGTEFPWVLKHPKKEEIIGQFKSRKDAVFWYISFKLETLILLLNEKNEQVGQIAYIKDPDYNNKFIMIPQSSGLDANETYISLCDEFEIDPLKFYKLNTDAEIDEYIKHLKFSYSADPKTYFESRYEIKKRDKEEYLNADAKVKMKQIELAGLSDLDRHSRSEAAKELDDLSATNTIVIEPSASVKENTMSFKKTEAVSEKEVMPEAKNEVMDKEVMTSSKMTDETEASDNKESMMTSEEEKSSQTDSSMQMSTAMPKSKKQKSVGRIVGYVILALITLGVIAFGVICLLDWLGTTDLLPFISPK
ncbi:hypothetical protein MBOVJF4428_00323 [Mycoplasmopsis agalactiae]|uniref:Uncharacterized protein n=1 Tax=Mycoplasmopsis agalactiae (strain NCTC 10123 / CIP 59.7 / PG2) TaxID=347257 RepID=A5IY98_MYCAP|nr:hypothetical protein [Mycoplasmopsis agalactiae]MCE6057078.1 hypothetical protein [Mycoplasmopsis agalactiae]MCE6078865.1 hypothetical protein [Mycoplasmopsis agalactiae]MCE6095250.1 hypothetical protein [Mycoplasmopsis agalactiae]MCE6114505.1 hypothetical protein [Mycoplasmopsis agalactiae]NLS34341.1 hypothetical protein [Mycoplasmopsis agalactiae]